MRELVLMRHAEAAAASTNAEDFQRPLTAVGHSTAAQAARQLLIERWAPQRILCSPALRSQQTAEVILRALTLPDSLLQTDATIYQGTPGALRRIVSHCEVRVERLLLIGHNPGISQWLIELFPARGEAGLAPAEFQLVALPIVHWSELGAA